MNHWPGLCTCGCGGKTNIAPRNSRKHGWIRGEPLPYLLNHRPRASAWTKTEDQIVRAAYATTSAYGIGRQLGRSENSVWMRARALGLDKRPEVHHPWTEDDLAELNRSYAAEPAAIIAQRLGRSSSAVYQQARVLGLVSNKTRINRSVISDYFHEINSVEQAYILGLLAADGNVSESGQIALGLQVKDAHLVRFVHDRLAPEHSTYVATQRDSHTSFSFTSHKMAGDLARWGIVPRKSRVIAWPRGLGDLQRPFLLGYFDGDGSACVVTSRGRRYPNWSVCSGSGSFLVDLKDYVRESAAVELQKIQHRPKSSLYQVAVSGAGAYTLDKWLHQDDGLGLARKRYPADAVKRYQTSTTP